MKILKNIARIIGFSGAIGLLCLNWKIAICVIFFVIGLDLYNFIEINENFEEKSKF